jgi:TonB family protein
METVVPSPVDVELNLLTKWGDPSDGQRRRTAAIGTFGVHLVGIAILLLLPRSWFEPPPRQPEIARHITPIFLPPLTKLTQKAPNNGKVSKQFTADEPSPLPRRPLPSSPPPAPKPAPVRQAAIPPAAPPKPVQQMQPLPEPPKVQAMVNPPKIEVPGAAVIPPPQLPQSQERPKLTLENLAPATSGVPAEQRQVKMPDTSVEGALRAAAGGVSRPPAPVQGPPSGSSLELPQLLSDSQGVDFTPYLRIILQNVRRNWMSIMPESVRQGRRGKVVIVFEISRDGTTPKVVFAEQSGVDSLDRAAVAAISMSNPFPPLPAQFKGSKIAVQFNFAYNMPKQ